MKQRLIIVIVLILSAGMWGCAGQGEKTRKGAGYGAAGGALIGAGLGQAIGRNTEGTLAGAAIGAAVGGAAGASVGKMMDRQEEEYRRALAASEASQVRREGNIIAITLKGDIVFDTDSAQVNPGLLSEIDRIADIMIQYPETRIRVEGHTDSRGSEEYNMELSRRRADAVKDLLVKRGVNPVRITIVPLGESLPRATNDTPAGRMLNRRVEIKVEPSST